MLGKVLLATDASKDATLAARAAVDVCERTGAELHVVHVWYSVPTALPVIARHPCLRPSPHATDESEVTPPIPGLLAGGRCFIT